MIIQKSNGLKIAFWNIQSQVHKLHFIEETLLKNEIDIFIILESWLRPEIEDRMVRIKNYLLFRQDRAELTAYNTPKRGGGICMYIKNTIQFTALDGPIFLVNNANLEMASVQICLPNVRPIFVVSIYRPPSGSFDLFNNHMINVLNKITSYRMYDLYVGGDFNINYKVNSPARKILKDLEVQYDLFQLVQCNTRPLYSTSIVDLIFTNNKEFSHFGSIDLNISDHIPIFVIRKKVKVKRTSAEFIGRTYRNYSKDILHKKLNEIDWDELYELDCPNKKWDLFLSRLNPILDVICPIRRSKYTNSRPPWITQELIELANDRDKAMKLARKSPTVLNVSNARALRNEAKLAFRRIREEYIKARLEEHKNDPKKCWRDLETVIPGKKSQNCDLINIVDDNNEALSKDITSTYVNNFFTTIGQQLAMNIKNLTQHDIQLVENRSPNFLSLPKLEITSFTLEEVIKEIENINIYKSSGIQNILSRILKDVWSIMPTILHNILNSSIGLAVFPDSWKIGTVIPIPKVPNPHNVTDLRPITLLPIPGKILERLVHNKLYPYL